jgi:hypothetical protein
LPASGRLLRMAGAFELRTAPKPFRKLKQQ